MEIASGKSITEIKRSPQLNFTKTAAPTPAEKPKVEIFDKMLATPFGMHYGKRIDSILSEIFSNDMDELSEELRDYVVNAFDNFKETNNVSIDSETVKKLCTWLITSTIGSFAFIGNFLRKDNNLDKQFITDFTNNLFKIFFELKFKAIFKIIRHQENISFACSFIIKRIYINFGEEIPEYGLFLINAASQFDKNQNL
jgi:hypothetical protein